MTVYPFPEPNGTKRPTPTMRELVTIRFGSKPTAFILIEDGVVTHKSEELDKYFWMASPGAVISKASCLPGAQRVTSRRF